MDDNFCRQKFPDLRYIYVPYKLSVLVSVIYDILYRSHCVRRPFPLPTPWTANLIQIYTSLALLVTFVHSTVFIVRWLEFEH